MLSGCIAFGASQAYADYMGTEADYNQGFEAGESYGEKTAACFVATDADLAVAGTWSCYAVYTSDGRKVHSNLPGAPTADDQAEAKKRFRPAASVKCVCTNTDGRNAETPPQDSANIANSVGFCVGVAFGWNNPPPAPAPTPAPSDCPPKKKDEPKKSDTSRPAGSK